MTDPLEKPSGGSSLWCRIVRMDLETLSKQVSETKQKIEKLKVSLDQEQAKLKALLPQAKQFVIDLEKAAGVYEAATTGKRRGRPPKNPAVSGAGEGAGSGAEAKKAYKCGFCKEAGHNARNCPKKATS